MKSKQKRILEKSGIVLTLLAILWCLLSSCSQELEVHAEENGAVQGVPDLYLERFLKDRELLGDYVPQTESAVMLQRERNQGQLTTGKQVFYDGYSTNEFYVDGNFAYCAQPSRTTPPSGSYEKIYDFKRYLSTQSAEQAEGVRRVMYYCYGSPGFDPGMFPDSWIDGSVMNADRYIALSHILISDVYAFDAVSSMAGCSRAFMNWVAHNVTGYDISTGAEINPNSTRHQALGKGAPDTFKAFILDTGGAQNILGFEYNPKGSLELLKSSGNPDMTEQNPNYSLEGAVYGIWQNDTEVGTITTDRNGWGIIYDLLPGEYQVREKSAPQGFVLDVTTYNVTVSGGQTNRIEVTDVPQQGKISLQKMDGENEKNQAQGAGSLKGAVYDIFLKSAYQEGDHTESASWRGTLTTDENGMAESGELPLDIYYVTERQASEGYLVDPTLHEVKLTPENATDRVFISRVESRENIIRGNVEIIKLKEKEDEDSDTFEGLEGVEFTFTSDTTGEVVKKIVTDKNGYATTAEEGNPRGGLVYDTYTVTETKCPEGLKPIEPFQVTIKEDSVTLKGIYKEDKLIVSPVSVVKVDKSTGKRIPVAGVEFRLLDDRKKPVEMTTYYPDKVVHKTFRTDENGQFTFPAKLKMGVYYLEELKAPSGYLKGELLKFEVKEGDVWDNPLVVQYEDENVMGKIRIIKQSHESEEKLSGAVFEIRAAEDIITPDGTVRMKQGELADTLTTDAGEAVSKSLYLGKYEVQETKQPDGYVLDGESKVIELTYKDQETEVVISELEVLNKPTEITLIKIDAKSEKPLAGVRFKVWNKGMESETDPEMGLVQEFVTGEDGRFTIQRLMPGTYCFQETETLPGYILNEEIYELTVEKDGRVNGKESGLLIVKNEPVKPEEPPKEEPPKEEPPEEEPPKEEPPKEEPPKEETPKPETPVVETGDGLRLRKQLMITVVSGVGLLIAVWQRQRKIMMRQERKSRKRR